MTLYLNMKKEEKEKLVEMWNTLATKFEKFGYKPTEATEKQRDYINDLIRYLDRRDAAVLITLLQILNKYNKE